ncbi:MAG: class I SAM-dependent methyltransferase [Rhodothermales bacterium]|nr:class I SAM-dependent methyltransferase [Rhodothermales bacterium]
MATLTSYKKLAQKLVRQRRRDDVRARIGQLRERIDRTGAALRTGRAGVIAHLARVIAAEGMTNPDECLLLMELAAAVEDGAIVEIGSYRGRSTVALAIGSQCGNGRPVYAVEPHEEFVGEFGAHFGPADRTAFFKNVLRCHASETVRLINLPAETVARSWDLPIGLLWIDGDHRYEAVKKDYEMWTPHLRPGTLVCFDDSATGKGGPHRLVSELTQSGAYRTVEVVGKVTVLRHA